MRSILAWLDDDIHTPALIITVYAIVTTLYSWQRERRERAALDESFDRSKTN